MGFKLENVIPWGRSLQEYIKMFDLTPKELNWIILDCASGPASFNAEMTKQGYQVVSCDPIYQFTAREILQRIQDTYQAIVDGTQVNWDKFVWHDIPSPEQLGQVRMAAMSQFLEDFSIGIKEGRYVIDELPTLPFNNSQFDLALCSHFLFTYSEQFSETFHLNSILEMCRVATEVRIFPLLVNFSGEISPWLQPVMSELQERGLNVEIKQVSYEFQKGGNKMLCIVSN